MSAPLPPVMAGRTVLITADRRSDDLADAFARRGATIHHAPAMTIVHHSDDEQLVDDTRALVADPPDALVITTGAGLRGWMEAAEVAGLDDALRAALDRLPERLHRAMALDWSGLADELAGASAVFVAARGLGLGSAAGVDDWHLERLARLAGGVSVIKVGAATEVEACRRLGMPLTLIGRCADPTYFSQRIAAHLGDQVRWLGAMAPGDWTGAITAALTESLGPDAVWLLLPGPALGLAAYVLTRRRAGW